MNDLDILTAKTQSSLTRITLVGFLLMLAALLVLLCLPDLKPSANLVALVSAATGSLGTILTQQNGFWFARHRPSSQPDQNGSSGVEPSNPTQPAEPAK